ncbi:zinc transporter ZntB [Sphingomonas japonica]|uniref:Zinc transporter n=1 Tax=Sphingomonas japonica TaxID=511662 RepID=A0ABX0U363_9SPHN|nr:zinc transporter ZntB [Sphingomonas japonica]NIJ23816.1 zinc transporter [Sphingomonas japonica]
MSGFAYRVVGGKATAIPVDEARCNGGDLIWAHLHTRDDEARRWLADKASLPDVVVDALTATETRPRCDAVGDGAILNLRGLSSDDMVASDPLASVRIHAEANCVISVTRKSMEALAVVRAAMEAGRIGDPGDLIVAFAGAITEELDPVVADLGDTLDSCEEELGQENVFELRRTVAHTRSDAIGYRRFLNPQRAALEKLAQLPADWLTDEDRLHLATAADRAARMAEEVESIRERAALIHEALIDLRAEQIDQRTLVISIVAMVFLPLTFLTGLLGMNVEGIPFAHAPWAFWGVVGVSALLSVVIAGYFVQRHWFR